MPTSSRYDLHKPMRADVGIRPYKPIFSLQKPKKERSDERSFFVTIFATTFGYINKKLFVV